MDEDITKEEKEEEQEEEEEEVFFRLFVEDRNLKTA